MRRIGEQDGDMPNNLTRETRARMICVLSASNGLPAEQSTLALARSIRNDNESVLRITFAGPDAPSNLTLTQVLSGEAQLCDVKTICPQTGIISVAAGHAKLEDMLGIIAALSLSYDNVIIAAPSGCTPAHIRLAAAADVNILHFDSQGDKFMRAFWMMDALRARCAGLDPMLIACGPKSEATEAHEMLSGTIREFLGAPPPLSAIISKSVMHDGVAAHIMSRLNLAEDARLRA